ncbi:Sua5/YciO/YrdC/YwlC family protein [Aeromicrobium marinum DSM 15272]|uniref:L-threonylcarbamoyladenylate synthase n=1 Tax=Aeromicrobium marinum DSM 15272 TaxID=585531 RepID=E2SCR2_9ACTN|nr:L-threonylcarbamoyladenylate synthase [Aeromicrobium marinum]EFQ83015.1 Sua5/YciO/YrdC/YwlC family protein [Aeromicrobium marinum DSM 15272]
MRYDCTTPGDDFHAGIAAAVEALAADRLVVVPTDTVYGIAANSFSPSAVARLLAAKGRGRDMPPPVLVGAPTTIEALATDIPSWLRHLIGRHWPGPLTVVCRQQPSLTWDLGDTHDTVAVRMPDDPVALAVLRDSGPLAVSSANTTGAPAATTVEQAEEMLGDSVAVYLDGGPSRGGTPSTILDVTAHTPRILRAGAIDLETLHEFNNTIEDVRGA